MKTTITTSGQLGPFLKHLRGQRGLSQVALGQKIGLSQERISRIENHPEAVTFDQILTIMMALDATITAEPRPLPGTEQPQSQSQPLPTSDQDRW